MDKKVFINLDLSRCVGCYACVVACQDQHYDVDEKGPALRRVVRYEDAKSGVIKCVSIGCLHCADAPCLATCPTEAIWRDRETALVQIDESKCVGCRSCLKACPFGAPQFTEENKMIKCDGCLVRLQHGLPPVCVKTCPSAALSLRKENDAGRNDSLCRRRS